MALPSFMYAPHTEDHGKQHATTRPPHYRTWDFLKHPEQTQSSSISSSSTRESKFKVGFYRRPHDVIAPAAEREQYQQQRAERSQIQQQQRQQQIIQNQVRHGNIITNKTKQGDLEAVSQERVHKKHIGYDEYREGTEKQNLNRQREGSSRFHVVLDDQQAQSLSRRYSSRYHGPAQTSCILGYGRADIPSSGVLDAFIGHGYTQKDLITTHGHGRKARVTSISTTTTLGQTRDTIIAPQPSTTISRPAKRPIAHRANQKHESPIC